MSSMISSLTVYKAEFHSQTSIEAAKRIYAQLQERGKSAKDIKDITIRTHEACIRIIDKQFKPMDNFADRDHCIQVCASALEPGRLLTSIPVHDRRYACVQPT